MNQPSKKRKILIVDDEEDICTIFKDILLEYDEKSDYEVDYATTAKEALEYLKSKPYDLMFVDIKLKGTASGIDIIKECRELHSMPKIVVVSAIPEKAMQPTFRERGISGLIEKYLEKKDDLLPEVIVRTINNIFNKSEEGK